MEVVKAVSVSFIEDDDKYMTYLQGKYKVQVFKTAPTCYLLVGTEERISKVREMVKKYKKTAYFWKVVKRNGRSWQYKEELQARLSKEENVSFYPLSGQHSSTKVPQFQWSAFELSTYWADQQEQKSYALVDTTKGLHCVECLKGDIDLNTKIPAGLVVWARKRLVSSTRSKEEQLETIESFFEVVPDAIFETKSGGYIGFYPF